MKRLKKQLLILLLVLGCVTLQSLNKPKLIHVLIVDGFSNHDWKQTSKVVKDMLEESGRFSVDISTMPAQPNDPALGNWNPKFSDYDLVVQNTNNINLKGVQWPKQVEIALENYVKAGGGLYVLHSGNNAFAHWKEYDKMIGMGWRSKETGYAIEVSDAGELIRIPPGEGKGTSHGKRFDALINVLTPHPINKGFPKQWVTADMELYTYARGPAENTTVLSYAYEAATKKNWPVEWVVQYGKGRVYTSSMGHLWAGETYPIAYRCIGFQTTMIRAAEWLATGKTKYKVPANFPTKDGLSVRAETDYPKK